jgi:hypothetical protein
MGDERARYRRATIRDRAVEAVEAIRANPRRSLLIAAIVALGAYASLRGVGAATIERLGVGDCLYVRTSAVMQTGAGARPIGEPGEVETVLDADQAEHAPCDQSHGHEVVAVVTFPLPTPASPGSMPVAPPPSETRALVQPRCEDAFPAYVGHALAGSRYVVFSVVPFASSPLNGTLGVCLLARADGQWMSKPARGSGE